MGFSWLFLLLYWFTLLMLSLAMGVGFSWIVLFALWVFALLVGLVLSKLVLLVNVRLHTCRVCGVVTCVFSLHMKLFSTCLTR